MISTPETACGLALAPRQRAAALTYRDLRHRFEAACRSARRGGAGLAMTEAAWHALKRRHEALIAAAGFERFLLDRMLLDGEAPLRCETGRVGEALGRVALNLPRLGGDPGSRPAQARSAAS